MGRHPGLHWLYMPSARRMQFAKLRVAVTAMTALVILGVLVYLLGRGRLFVEWEQVRVYVSDASGLVQGTPVRLNGIPVGEVEEVRFIGRGDQRLVEVVLRIARYHRQRIRADSIVTITPQNIQGEQFVDIAQGNSPAIVAPGGELRFEPTPEVLRALDLAQFQQRLRDIDNLLAEIEEGKGAMGQMVRGEDFYRSTLASIRRVEKALDTALGPQRSLGRLLYQDLRYEELIEPLRRLDARLAAIQRGEGTAGRLLQNPAQYDDLRRRAAALHAALADLNAGRGRWGGFVADSAAYDRLVRRLGRLVESVDAMASGEGTLGRLVASEQPYESLNGALLVMRHNLEDFRRNPKKYLRVALF
jgi:phospholipid/cholesterol/gamma-HCH transport system substrate-binding protein